MATYSADYLKRLLTAVERFEEAFGRWRPSVRGAADSPRRRLGSTKSTSELSMAYGKDLALAEALRKKAVPQARVILEGAAAAGTETPAASLLDK
ncbi:hypothetical protein [Streptomyces griseosporeus]